MHLTLDRLHDRRHRRRRRRSSNASTAVHRRRSRSRRNHHHHLHLLLRSRHTVEGWLRDERSLHEVSWVSGSRLRVRGGSRGGRCRRGRRGRSSPRASPAVARRARPAANLHPPLREHARSPRPFLLQPSQQRRPRGAQADVLGVHVLHRPAAVHLAPEHHAQDRILPLLVPPFLRIRLNQEREKLLLGHRPVRVPQHAQEHLRLRRPHSLHLWHREAHVADG
mmetsp:Transcript_11169/g.36752  ORF Transcript_11169/g.36752 Transcript_11169/m.36752 type:complete len:223 (-) Transcript_11169:116-784(-)